MASLVINTDNLISISDLRKDLTQVVQKLESKEKEYFVLMENRKIVALIADPSYLKDIMKIPQSEPLRLE